MTAERQFPITQRPYGDSGRRPFARITCSTCGAHAELNAMAHGGSMLPDSVIRKKFQERGWEISSRDNRDRCSECVKGDRASKTQRNPDMENKVVAITPANQQARSPGFDDNRIIYEKLTDVYVNDKVGYSNGWSDQKVATDLGVPRKWVEDIRAQFFGKLGSDSEVEQFLAEYQRAHHDAALSFSKIEKLKEQIDALLKNPAWNEWEELKGRLTRLERHADALRKLTP